LGTLPLILEATMASGAFPIFATACSEVVEI
jgi:hypothetical protein